MKEVILLVGCRTEDGELPALGTPIPKQIVQAVQKLKEEGLNVDLQQGLMALGILPPLKGWGYTWLHIQPPDSMKKKVGYVSQKLQEVGARVYVDREAGTTEREFPPAFLKLMADVIEEATGEKIDLQRLNRGDLADLSLFSLGIVPSSE
jgi:hypothetical protein